jgi:hypothetical protein
VAAVALLGTPTFTTAAGNKTVTAAPSIGDLIVIVCANSGRTTAQDPTVTDDNAGGGGTYTQVQENTKNVSADTMWIYIRNDLIKSVASTVFTFSPLAAGDTGGGLVVLRVTGMWRAGASAKRKSGGQDNQAAAGTPGPSWTGGGSATGLNPLIGAILNGTNPAGMTKPASFDTEQFDNGYNTPPTGLEVVSDNTGNTDSTVTWGGTSASAFCSSILELDSTPEGQRRFQERTALQAVNRAGTY